MMGHAGGEALTRVNPSRACPLVDLDHRLPIRPAAILACTSFAGFLRMRDVPSRCDTPDAPPA